MTKKSMERQETSSTVFWLSIIWKTLVYIYRLVVFAFVTLAWGVAFALAFTANGWVALMLVMLVCLGTIAMAIWWKPVFWQVVPFVGEYRRWVKKRSERKLFEDGNNFARHMKIIPDDGKIYPISLEEHPEEVVFRVLSPIEGLPSERIIAEARRYQDYWHAKRIRVHLHDQGVFLTIRFILIDPLDQPVVIYAPANLDEQTMSLEVARDGSGEPVVMTLGENSGMVAGGVPSGGKTAGISTMLVPFAMSDAISLHIIDGKGGDDLSAFAESANTFIAGDEDLVIIRDFLAEHYQRMVHRIQKNKALLGVSNFWGASAEARTNAGLKFELLLIDECQGIFETAGRTKEERELLTEIYRYCSALVKKGRSAGFFTIFATQKPTAEALPTGIRDNCGLRVAFRLTTTQAELAVLGALPDGMDIPRAVEIPADRKGGAVIATNSGNLVEVRFYYMPENVQHSILRGREIYE